MEKLTSLKTLRAAFWRENPQAARRRGRGQNDQTTDTRCAFCDWLDAQQKAGRVSERLADRATL